MQNMDDIIQNKEQLRQVLCLSTLHTSLLTTQAPLERKITISNLGRMKAPTTFRSESKRHEASKYNYGENNPLGEGHSTRT